MKPKKANVVELVDAIGKLEDKDDTAIGSYLLNGYHVQISKYKLSAKERVLQLYHRRRKEGRCVQCGKKVRRVNKRTGRPYRLCPFHQKKIDDSR